MSRGPQKPTSLRALEGGRSHSLPNPESVQEPKPAVVEPRKPQYLDQHAKYIWDTVAPALVGLGLLTEIDGIMFAALCQTASRQRDIENTLQQLDSKGKPYVRLLVTQTKWFGKDMTMKEEVPNPLITMSRQNMELLRKLAKEFGMTPTARAGLVVGDGSEGGDDLLD